MRVKEEKPRGAGNVLLLLHPEFIDLLAFRSGARNRRDGLAPARSANIAPAWKGFNNTIALFNGERAPCSQNNCIVERSLSVSKLITSRFDAITSYMACDLASASCSVDGHSCTHAR